MTQSDASGTTGLPIAEALAAQRTIFRSLLGTTASAWMQLELPIGQLRTLMRKTYRPARAGTVIPEAATVAADASTAPSKVSL